MIGIAEGVQVAFVTGAFGVLCSLIGAAIHLNKRDHDRNAALAREGFEELASKIGDLRAVTDDAREDVHDTRADVRDIKADLRDNIRPRLQRLEET